MITILIAVAAGFFVTTQQQKNKITALLASPAATDNLKAIELLHNASFDKLFESLPEIINKDNDASIAAQDLLVARALSAHRVEELQPIQLRDGLFEAAMWWNTNPVNSQPQSLDIDINSAPWVKELSLLMGSVNTPPTYQELINFPLRDRDGSVLLAVLAIENIGVQQMDPLVQDWSSDYDLERQKAAVLLSALSSSPLREIPTHNASLATLQTIINDQNYQLAWRSMHNEDGTINPDIALAAMLVDQEKFLPVLIETARNHRWKHPDHPVVLARRFVPQVASKISSKYLKNDESRRKWWTLFACGLLVEER